MPIFMPCRLMLIIIFFDADYYSFSPPFALHADAAAAAPYAIAAMRAPLLPLMLMLPDMSFTLKQRAVIRDDAAAMLAIRC